MKLILFLIIFCCNICPGQDLKQLVKIQKNADKLVASFWGQTNFTKYIHLDKQRSEYLVFGDMWERECKFDSNLTFKPNTYLYRYKIIHSAFQGDTAYIELYLDSAGKLMTGFQPSGLFHCGDLDKLKVVTKQTAIDVAKRLGLEQGQGKWTISLSWLETGLDNVYSFGHGRFVWDVKSTIDKSYHDGCFFYNKRTYSIDILTGRLIAKSDLGETEPTKGGH